MVESQSDWSRGTEEFRRTDNSILDCSIPMIDLGMQYHQIRDEVKSAVCNVLSSQRFIYGPEVSELEREISVYCQSAYGIACASGSDAIYLALLALGIGPGDNVICPSFTFFATAGSIVRTGATPVFVDIDPFTYNLNSSMITDAIGRCKNLKAIVVVHLFGRCAPMHELEVIANKLDVPLIEDAAQAIGSEDILSRRAGSIGLFGCFSFYPTKNLGGIGDGGMIVTNDTKFADKLRLLREHGARVKYVHELVGTNSRLDAIQAAVLRVKLHYLDGWIARRQYNANYYTKLFSNSSCIDKISLPAFCNSRHVFNQYVIRVLGGRRDGLREHLKENNIGCEVYYPIPLHLQKCFVQLGYCSGQLPNSELASTEVLALPIYPELSECQIGKIVNVVCDYFRL